MTQLGSGLKSLSYLSRLPLASGEHLKRLCRMVNFEKLFIRLFVFYLYTIMHYYYSQRRLYLFFTLGKLLALSWVSLKKQTGEELSNNFAMG